MQIARLSMLHAPHHAGTAFLVPMAGRPPDVGFVASPVAESLADEVAEIAARYAGRFPGSARAAHAILLLLSLEIVNLLKRRAEADLEDFPKPLPTAQTGISPETQRRLVASHLGRLLDWICKGRRVLDMGPRAFVVASHVRAAAVDHRTDQEAATEMGNDSRASINKLKGEFRRSLGADYPGENGKGSNTKARCKNSRIEQLEN